MLLLFSGFPLVSDPSHNSTAGCKNVQMGLRGIHAACVFWAQRLQLIWWDYTLGMGKFPASWLTSFIASDALFWKGQGVWVQKRKEKREGDGKMIEWGGCGGRERQSGDGKWQYNMIWFVGQNGFSVPIFWKRGDGKQKGGVRNMEVGGVWTVRLRSSFSTRAVSWLDSCWWRH